MFSIFLTVLRIFQVSSIFLVVNFSEKLYEYNIYHNILI